MNGKDVAFLLYTIEELETLERGCIVDFNNHKGTVESSLE